MLLLQFANIIKPQHDRTTCSDSNPCNGFGSADEIRVFATKKDEDGTEWVAAKPKLYPGYRCTRCAVLGVLRDDYPLEDDYLEYAERNGHDVIAATIRFSKTK